MHMKGLHTRLHAKNPDHGSLSNGGCRIVAGATKEDLFAPVNSVLQRKGC